MSKRHQKIHILKTLTHYGVHIWAILIIANATLAYAFHFSTQAASNDGKSAEQTTSTTKQQDESTSNDEEPSEAPQSAKKPKPVGTTISLVFTIPGIGSGSANMVPKRLERNVTFYLFAPDANSLNKTVKPLHTVKTIAKYDTNTLSPTYTSYKIDAFDFGGDIKPGKYQIAFRTDESLRTLVKENPEKVGGQLFEFRQGAKIQRLPSQIVYMGDTLPKEGDNIVDIGDYNAFVNCFGERNTDTFCTGNNYGDFDDNGVIDGVDYNLLLRSFSVLLEQGQTIPKITVAPTGSSRVTRLSNLTTPTEAEKEPAPTNAAEEKTVTASGSGGNVLGGILFFLFLLIAGTIVFILFKKNEKFRTTIKSILHMSPTGTPPPPPADPNAPEGEAAAQDSTPPQDEETTTPTPEQPTDPNAIASSTEIPVNQTPELPADPSAIAASTEIPVNQTPPATPPSDAPPAPGETIEKDCYVKKLGLDEAGTGVWMRLTDDNGALEAHYTKADIEDGFAKVKGVMKTENGKTFLEVSELTPEG